MNNLIRIPILILLLSGLSYAQANTFYCVHDGSLNDSQFCEGMPPFQALGPVYEDCDIEALDISPVTSDVYAAAGDDTPRKSHLYYVFKNNGDVVDLGNIGGPGFLEEVDALSFHPVTDQLWGWSQDGGLFVIPVLPAFPQPAIQPVVDINNSHCLKPVEEVTIQAELVAPNNEREVEDITWNLTGDVLYAVENIHTDDPDHHGDNENHWPGPPFDIDYDDGIVLWAYANGEVIQLCPNLVPSIVEAIGHEAEIEGLEALPNNFMPIPAANDLLVATFHGPYEMYYAMIAVQPMLPVPQCDIWIGSVGVSFNDIEGIAYLPQCPVDKAELVAKFEWTENGYVFEKPEGNDDLVTITGNAVSGTWSSKIPISHIILKGGTNTGIIEVFGQMSGEFSNIVILPNNGGNIPDISNIQFFGCL